PAVRRGKCGSCFSIRVRSRGEASEWGPPGPSTSLLIPCGMRSFGRDDRGDFRGQECPRHTRVPAPHLVYEIKTSKNCRFSAFRNDYLMSNNRKTKAAKSCHSLTI